MYPNLLNAFLSAPWAILPAKLAEIRAFLVLKAQGGTVDAEEIRHIVAGRRKPVAQDRFDDAQENFPATRGRLGNVQMAGRVAVLSVMGTICQHAGSMECASGGISTEKIGAALDGLAADRTVKCVVMVFDSPGGAVFGVEELGRKILSLRNEKKIVAVADSLCASAAYWLASQCSEVVCTPGGQIGSIGVLAAHEDMTAAYEQAGVKPTLITSTPYKAEFAQEVALSEEARAELQKTVDAYHALFVAAVARGRGCSEARVRSEFGQGRMVMAAEAKDRGMCDTVATLEKTLTRLGANSDGPRAATPGASPTAAVPIVAAAKPNDDEEDDGEDDEDDKKKVKAKPVKEDEEDDSDPDKDDKEKDGKKKKAQTTPARAALARARAVEVGAALGRSPIVARDL